ncbi:hypothetical protein [Mycobacterium sp. D16R24]|uniref:hypothetical protein n=1 Tax=Mycobacterium sp. D16R24 TaxID=1855656 RepID=UPI002570BA25|nr:hypothetical protein [Mycobacterium sp. D16R24]
MTEDTGDLSTEVTDVLVPDFCDSNEDPFASVKYDPYGDDPFAPPHQEARQRLLAAIASEGGAIPARSAQGLAEVPGGEIAAVVESLIADGLVIHDKSSEVDTLRLV